MDWEERRRLLAELQGGAPPTRETAKLYLIWKTLGLRASTAETFAGSYEPLDAGPAVCAFTRGGGEILVAVPLRPGARFEPPPEYDDALDGADLGVWLLRRRA